MSLKVWLPLDGDLRNLGASNGNFSIKTALTYTDNGKIGKACSGGTITIDANTTASILNNQEFSFTCWVYINSAEGSTSNRGMFFGNSNMGANNNRKFSIFQYPTCNDLHLSWMNDAASTVFIGTIWSGVFPSYKWTHVAVTYKNPNGTIYINGIKYATWSGISNSSSFEYETYLFQNAPDQTRYLNDYRIYDHCLSAAEVREIARGLVLHYKLDKNNPNLAIGTNTNDTVTNAWYLSMQTGDKTVSIENEGSIPIVVITRGTIERSGWRYLQYSKIDRQSIKTDTTYTVSFDVWSSNSGSITLTGLLQGNATNYMTDSVINIKTTVTANKWNHILLQCKTKTDFSDIIISSQVIYMGISESLCAVNSILKFKNMKLEEGTTETPWCPNSSDALYSILGYDTTIVEDSSGYNHNGETINEIIVSSNTSRYTSSAKFNGSNATIKVPDNIWMAQGAEAITINLWAKSTAWAGAHLFSCTEGGGFNTEAGDSGYLRFPIHVYTNAEKTSTTYKYDSKEIEIASLSTTDWNMLTFVYDSTGTRTYVNGELHHTYSNTSYGIHFNTNARLFLGCEANVASPSSPYFNGQISDFRIYCTPLLDNDIKMLYNVGMKVDNLGNIHTYELEETNNQNKILKTGITKSANFFEDLYYDKIAHIGKQMNDNILNPNDLEVITTNNSSIKTGSLGVIPAATMQALAGKTLIFSYDVYAPGERLSEVNGDTAFTKVRYGIHGVMPYVNASGTSGTNYPFASYLTYSGDSKHTVQTWTIPTNYQSYDDLYFAIQNFDTPSNNNSDTWFIKNVRLEIQENTTNGWISGTNLIEI